MRIRTIVVSGGGAKSELWNQMKANVTGKRVLVPQVLETSCMGAAILAAAGSGMRRDVSRAARTMVKIARVYAPDRETWRAYRGPLERYRACIAKLKAPLVESD